jgi:hypothetical protein
MMACCYSPYSFTPHLSFLVLTTNSYSVGTIFLQLVPLLVPHRIHFLFSFPSVTDLTPFLKPPTGKGLLCSSRLLFLLTYHILSIGLSYLLNRFSCIGS